MWAWRAGQMALLVGVVAASSDSGAWSRYNYATSQRRSPLDWTLPQQAGGRQSIFARIWEDSTPNNPFLSQQRTPTPPPIRPHLSKNDFITEDDYGDDDATDLLWLPQSRFAKTDAAADPPDQRRQHSTSLEGLQHLLEGELSPVHRPTKVDGEQRQHLGRGGFDLRRQGIPGQDRLGKDVLRDYHGQRLPEDFAGRRAQFPKGYGDHDAFPGDLLSSPRHPQLLRHEPFPSNLLGEGRQFPSSFRSHDVFNGVDHHDFPDHVTIPETFLSHHAFREFTHQQPSVGQQQLGEFQGSPHEEESAEILAEDEGPSWLPSSLSGLNLPSSKDLISAFTNPELTKEGHREACHARNLHTCGTRVIDEFSHEPGYQETCRIREEFLDCMEQQRGKPCHLHGERFSRDGTKLIRDRIKKLLWSARGCILGHSA